MPRASLGAGRHGSVARSDQNSFAGTKRPTAAGDPDGAVGATGPKNSARPHPCSEGN